MGKEKKTTCVCACLLLLIGIAVNFIYIKTLDGVWRKSLAQSEASDDENATNWLRDWQNRTEIERALSMEGFGEVGRAANFTEYHRELYNKYGFDALLSDALPLQRSVLDVRPEACKNLKYLSQLPSATIVITLHNERLSVLLRTVYSVLNRSPAKLLEEIIIVDDGSTWPDMHDELEISLKMRFTGGKVRLIRLGKRTGIMAARNAGARNATTSSEILIFLDSHFEVGYNWLPPLLEPIALNNKTCTCPIIDIIAYDTFQYRGNQPYRAFCDLNFYWRITSLSAEETRQPEKNFKNFAMMGGAMAINKDFFWQLGGFDDSMTFWGGEQFEMSFKIWMCGGEVVDVPCSRLGHLFRDTNTQSNALLYKDYSFCNRNYKRVLDVWIDDESRKIFLERRPALKDVDAGNLTERRLIRQRLKCKSFTWLVKNIFMDFYDHYLPLFNAELASGFLRNLDKFTLCFTLGTENKLTLQACPSANNVQNYAAFNWTYTSRGELRYHDGNCLESDLNGERVKLAVCHQNFGNQKWFYDRNSQWIMRLQKNVCLTAANSDDFRIRLAFCDAENLRQKWSFSYANATAMDLSEEFLTTF